MNTAVAGRHHIISYMWRERLTDKVSEMSITSVTSLSLYSHHL